MRLRDKTCLHAALHDGHFMSANVSPNIPMPRPLSGGRCGEYVPAMPRRRVSSVSKGISGAGRARDGARRMRRGWRKKDARTRLRARFQCGTAAITTRDAVGQRIETPEDGGFHMIVNRPTATSQTAHGHGAASWLGGGGGGSIAGVGEPRQVSGSRKGRESRLWQFHGNVQGAAM